MKDLERKELTQAIKENILYALAKHKNAALKIVFRFSGTYQGEQFRYKEVIDYFCGDFAYKRINFSNRIVDQDTAIDIIVSNFSYSDFSFINCKEKIGEVKCHGFGDYFGEDEFVFIYKRLNSRWE